MYKRTYMFLCKSLFVLPTLEVFFTPLSVAILAEVMMQDAWNYFSSGGSTAPSDKVAIFERNDIHQLGEVSNNINHSYCLIW